MMFRKINGLMSKKPLIINKKPIYSPKKIFFWVMFLSLSTLVISGFCFVDCSWFKIFNGLSNLKDKVKELTDWDFVDWTVKPDPAEPHFLAKTIYAIIETVVMTIGGTIIGIIFAIPVAIAASKNVIHNSLINRSTKAVLSVLRSIPAFLYALIFVGIFGANSCTIVVALSFSTFALATKLLYDKIEQTKMNTFEMLQATGASRLRSFRTAIIPQVSSHLLSTTFFNLETNIRGVAILGLVTRVGIGQMLYSSREFGKWNKIGWIIFLIILTVLIFELIDFFIKKFVLTDKDKVFSTQQITMITKPLAKILKMKDFKFYLNVIVLEQWNEKLQHLKANKTDLSKIQYKNEMLLLKRDRYLLVKNAIYHHQQAIKADKLKYSAINRNDKTKLFTYSEQLTKSIRVDKIYLTSFKININAKRIEIKDDIKKLSSSTSKKVNDSLTVIKVYNQQPLNWIKRLVTVALLAGLFVYSLTQIKWGFASQASIDTTKENIVKMFNIDWSTFKSNNELIHQSVFALIWETILIAVVGTFIGSICALILGILSSKNIVNFYVAKFFWTVSTVIRPIPSYVYAIILVSIIGMGSFTGAMAIAIATTRMLAKYIRELFDDIDLKFVETLQAVGANRWFRFRYGVLPQVKSNIFSWIIYRFETNIRDASILGLLGAGSLGFQIKAYSGEGKYEAFGALLLGIIINALLIEILSNIIRNKLIYNHDFKLYTFLRKKLRIYQVPYFIINAKLLNYNTNKISFDGLKAIYILTNNNILNKAFKYKFKDKLKWSIAYNKAYCEEFNLLIDNNDNMQPLNYATIAKNHNKKYLSLTKQLTQ